ncbi:hypothetical protein ACSTDW_20275, partial [Vibrio vulnificus]|uniref:hypothetical protein n=1 Tax=Vibrio vulnificus TaxID=672 RepID=UPI003EDA3224
SNNGKGRVFQSDGKEVKLTLTGYFWRYGIRKAIQVSIFRMNRYITQKKGAGTKRPFMKSDLCSLLVQSPPYSQILAIIID